MSSIVLAIAAVTGIGLLSAVMLSAASKVMSVKTDERFAPVRECLPGANCGACGYAGCDAYAQALISDSGVKTNLCVPGGAKTSRGISEALGVEFSDVKAVNAVVRCGGDCDMTSDKMNYQSAESCKAARLFYGGKGECAYGCLGLGDCVAVCPTNAIEIVRGIAFVDRTLCIGCGLCAKTCPNRVIEMIPADAKTYVACNSRDKGAAVVKKCKFGCIACKKCERECPDAGFVVEDNLARIDYEKGNPGAQCAEVCPRKCIAVR